MKPSDPTPFASRLPNKMRPVPMALAGYQVLDLLAILSTVVLAGWLAVVRWHAVWMN